MLKIGVLKNESVVFNSVERHLMKNNFFGVKNAVDCSVRKKVSACDGQRTRESKILVQDY